MCRELDALRQSLLAYAGRFDAQTLTAAQAGTVVRLCAQIEASAASIKALAAARSAEGRAWQDDGYRSPSDQLAHQAGMSPSAAKRALDTGRRLADQPEVARAALAGELSAEQAHAVTDGVAANPAKATELIDKAKHSSLPELHEEVARTKAAVTDQETRRRQPTPNAPCAAGPISTAPCKPTSTDIPKTAPACGKCSTPSAGASTCSAGKPPPTTRRPPSTPSTTTPS